MDVAQEALQESYVRKYRNETNGESHAVGGCYYAIRDYCRKNKVDFVLATGILITIMHFTLTLCCSNILFRLHNYTKRYKDEEIVYEHGRWRIEYLRINPNSLLIYNKKRMTTFFKSPSLKKIRWFTTINFRSLQLIYAIRGLHLLDKVQMPIEILHVHSKNQHLVVL